MHHKPFGGRFLLSPTGGAYRTPIDPLASLRVWAPGKGRGGSKVKGTRKEDKEAKIVKKKGIQNGGREVGRKNWVEKGRKKGR